MKGRAFFHGSMPKLMVMLFGGPLFCECSGLAWGGCSAVRASRHLITVLIFALVLGACSSDAPHPAQKSDIPERTQRALTHTPGNADDYPSAQPNGEPLDQAYCSGPGGEPTGPFGNAKACYMAACTNGDRASCSAAASYNGNLTQGDDRASVSKPFRLEDMEYLAARKIITGYGWRPVAGRCEGAVDPATCHVFPEIGNCSGTGVGYCDMAFSRKAQCLIVVTTGGAPQTSENYAQVRDVSFRSPPCAAAATEQ